MRFAYPIQKFQDWITQQWVITFGKRITPNQNKWLLGPFGSLSGTGSNFIDQLAARENLIIERGCKNRGLIKSVEALGLSEKEVMNLSGAIIDFYENTSNYYLDLKVKWNPFFKVFGSLLKVLFSNRIEQLNIPAGKMNDTNTLKNEIISLIDPETGEIKRTVWLRSYKANGQIVYSGVYETCVIPNGKICIKAIFPLPNGNATVILEPSVGANGALILVSSGRKIGDSGFYFLLNDSKGGVWTKYIKSFKDKLIVSDTNGRITAAQSLTLWNLNVLEFTYNIKKRM
ncbi:hypothetical protein MQE36_00460 [Zhouia spongiae]|uniref:Uncharacterized protein n=1 Tax=Zhouia spongiae TaxID=2202721 RepID=A0ABY3YLZ7_9FLAO|nr:hypothetical protein [Zhouia spongiae]UNY98842.1 hypothetical protein MQE36_00460 [Zhouia spongiae]